VFLAPSGTDANPCSQALPCKSFDRAYRVAASGQTVEVAAGSYGAQTLHYDGSKASSADVTFQPAAGASVTVAGIAFGTSRFDAGAAHVTIKDMTSSGSIWIPGCGQAADGGPCAAGGVPGSDLSFLNLHVKDLYAFVCSSCSDVLISGGVWGPDSYGCQAGNGSAHPEIQSAYQQVKRPNHITIQNSLWHNFARCTTGDHTECLQAEPADYLTLRGNTFANCDTMDVNIANDLANARSAAGYRAPDHVVVENNFFAVPTDATGGPTWFALNIRECTNCTVRYNSWLAPPRMPIGGEVSLNNVYEGNVGPMSPQNCGIAGVTYRYNVWSDAKCSASDKQAVSGFVNRAALDLHLAPGSPAINAGDPLDYPTTDVDAQARPMGGIPDAGADERQ
jgi:hypothetical protein